MNALYIMLCDNIFLQKLLMLIATFKDQSHGRVALVVAQYNCTLELIASYVANRWDKVISLYRLL